jgi:hypothetical protein
VAGRIDAFRGYNLVNNGATSGGVAACNPTADFGVGQNAFGGLVMNVTIINPDSAPGFAAVKPTQAAPLSSLINWYQSGSTVQLANQGILTMDQSAAASEFFVQTSTGVHVIIDIFGAFTAPQATALDVTTVTESTSVGAGANATVQASCTAGRTMTGGGCNWPFGTSMVFVSSNPIPGSNTTWNCAARNTGGAAVILTVYVRCGRVPGPVTRFQGSKVPRFQGSRVPWGFGPLTAGGTRREAVGRQAQQRL